MNRTCWLILLLGVIFPARFIRAQEAAPFKLVQSIDPPGVKGRIDHFAYDGETNRLFVAALENSTVEVIDLFGAKREAQIADMAKPQGVAVVAKTSAIAIARSGHGDLLLLDKNFNTLGTIDKLPDADNVRYDPRSGRFYVGFGDRKGGIAIVDSNTCKEIGRIELPAHPESFQLESLGPRIFINVPEAGEIIVVDREKQSVVAHWPVTAAKSNFPMALDETHHRLFVACRNPAKLLVYDIEKGKPSASLSCVGDADDVFYDPARHRIYITGGDGAISVFEQIDPDTYKLLATIPTAPGARTSLFVPQTDRLYVAVPLRGPQQQAQIRVYEPGPTK